MINENALAVYKNKPALVKEKSLDKITVVLPDGSQIKVREKDIEIIYSGTMGSREWDSINHSPSPTPHSPIIIEVWELLSADGEPVSLKELAGLAFNNFNPASAWAAYQLLADGLYFTGTINAILPKPKDQVEAEIKKREEKQKATGERERFL